MSNTSVRVEIYEAEKRLYEKNKNVGANNLSGLISCLKDTQLEINDFLTSLVEKRDGPANDEKRLTSDSESDLEVDVEVNPKKLKFFN